MVCPYLEYRDESADRGPFDEARAYCTAADRFVQPMRADICTDRYELVHERDCEIYRDHDDGLAENDPRATAPEDDHE
ncbi:hypothetical protein [Natrinema ejinorense]|uniref:Uncharacterized protein n=1 Tax=Natrinema ejinorense TaxID=373386 RepID=A0A2A5QUT5_9EURY|nr:hypothetical protein [Natrinema ejinorense]PCR90600.1 hypothetical protein CP557_08815 [Natrinema ejinorense]